MPIERINSLIFLNEETTVIKMILDFIFFFFKEKDKRGRQGNFFLSMRKLKVKLFFTKQC